MAEHEMTLVDRQRIARDTMAFWFDMNDVGFGFRAGQHADFVFKHPFIEGESDKSRTFSLASSPHDKKPVMIAMRMRKTAFKTALKSAALGTKFIVSRPRGSFTLHRDITRPAVFIAGGTGGVPPPQHPSAGHPKASATQTVFVLFEPGGGRRGVS